MSISGHSYVLQHVGKDPSTHFGKHGKGNEPHEYKRTYSEGKNLHADVSSDIRCYKSQHVCMQEL